MDRAVLDPWSLTIPCVDVELSSSLPWVSCQGRGQRGAARGVGDASLPKALTRRVNNKIDVLVIGGTGFVGYHAVQEFLRRGHKVTALALPPMPKDDLLPPDVNIRLADLNELPDEDVRALLQGQDALVYAAGADDRVIPKGPAYEFFFNANVKPSVRLSGYSRWPERPV